MNRAGIEITRIDEIAGLTQSVLSKMYVKVVTKKGNHVPNAVQLVFKLLRIWS